MRARKLRIRSGILISFISPCIISMKQLIRGTRRHFTLIEIAVVMVIIGIMAALIGPRVVLDVMGGRGIDASVRRLTAAGKHAANLAATRGRMHVLVLDINSGRFYVRAGDPDDADRTPRTEASHSLPPRVSFTGAELEDRRIDDVLYVRFTPDGWADNATVILEDEGGRRVRVSFTRSMGKVEISELR